MINWNKIENLGKVPDVDLARELQVTPQAVFQARKKLGVSAKNPANRYEINWDKVPLGKMIDLHIADMLGCSGAQVSKQRNQKGIPPFGMLYRTLENEGAYYEEAIIDAWLHNMNIKHAFQFNIGPYRVDWLIPDTNEVWEFLGMWNHKLYRDDYQKRFAIKQEYLTQCGYVVRPIHRKEIGEFKKDVDLKSLHAATNYKCKGCQRENVKHQAKGLCALCYGRIREGRLLSGPPTIKFLKPTDTFVCEDCGSTERHKQVKNKCHKCYSKAYKLLKKRDEIDMQTFGQKVIELKTQNLQVVAANTGAVNELV